MNKKIQKLRELTLTEWWLILVAVVMLPVVALSLRLGGFNRTKNLLSKFLAKDPGENRLQKQGTNQAKTIARMVSIAARYGPYRANCLKQSMVLWWLLGRRGLESEIRFGVRKEPDEEFGAHAWVEYEGINLIDSEVLQEQVAQFEKAGIGE